MWRPNWHGIRILLNGERLVEYDYRSAYPKETLMSHPDPTKVWLTYPSGYRYIIEYDPPDPTADAYPQTHHSYLDLVWGAIGAQAWMLAKLLEELHTPVDEGGPCWTWMAVKASELETQRRRVIDCVEVFVNRP